MVDSVDTSKTSSVSLNQTIKAKTNDNCENCDILKSECQKTLDELKSAQLVIEILRSEENSYGRLYDFHVSDGLKNKLCKCNIHDHIMQNRVLNNLNGSDKDQLELEVVFDRSELEELYSMAVCPWAQQMLLEAIKNVEECLKTPQKKDTLQKKWNYTQEKLC
jgi:hypothetical protein